jgi:hypothetical protein
VIFIADRVVGDSQESDDLAGMAEPETSAGFSESVTFPPKIRRTRQRSRPAFCGSGKFGWFTHWLVWLEIGRQRIGWPCRYMFSV